MTTKHSHDPHLVMIQLGMTTASRGTPEADALAHLSKEDAAALGTALSRKLAPMAEAKRAALTILKSVAPDADLGDLVERIDDFEAECEEEDYTDTGDAWNLLYVIRDRLTKLLDD